MTEIACQVCTYLNQPTATLCEMCESPVQGNTIASANASAGASGNVERELNPRVQQVTIGTVELPSSRNNEETAVQGNGGKNPSPKAKENRVELRGQSQQGQQQEQVQKVAANANNNGNANANANANAKANEKENIHLASMNTFLTTNSNSKPTNANATANINNNNTTNNGNASRTEVTNGRGTVNGILSSSSPTPGAIFRAPEPKKSPAKTVTFQDKKYEREKQQRIVEPIRSISNEVSQSQSQQKENTVEIPKEKNECWICSACTLENQPTAKICEVCETPREESVSTEIRCESESVLDVRATSCPPQTCPQVHSTPVEQPSSVIQPTSTIQPTILPPTASSLPVPPTNLCEAPPAAVNETSKCLTQPAPANPIIQVTGNIRHKTNSVARDMGCHFKLRCPICNFVCNVPPAVTSLQCACCGGYFASPTVGETTNFHVARVAKKLSSSIRTLFAPPDSSSPAEIETEESRILKEIPVGIPINENQMNQTTSAGSGSSTAAPYSRPISSLEESSVLVNGDVREL